MDYGKSGAILMAKKSPKHKDGKPGKEVAPGGRVTKAEMLARMKAAVEAKKKA